MIHQVKIRSPGSEVAVKLGSPVKLRSEAAVVSGNNNNRAASQVKVKVRQEAVIPECKVGETIIKTSNYILYSS